MTNTPNFNFTIAEGTDTVNLLTQLYPNFTSLDTILQAIKESGTTTAVTTKVGTVHNIVRNVADCNVIRWIATANYAAGDTFTVDGNAVTATAMDGTALPGGAFVINQSVLAILNSGVLTIVGVPGVSSVAASAVTYDNTGSGLSATDVQDAIDEVLTDIPANAAALSYDNTGSGLSASNVQDAIDELASTAGSEVSVTSNGSQTFGQVYDALYALLDLTKITAKTVLVDAGSVFQIGNESGLVFNAVDQDSAHAYLNQSILASSGSSKVTVTIAASPVFSRTDYSNITAPAGRLVKIIY